ncbi:MAG: Uma2 family endonuclease [Roseofilum sp. SBFL]|uniref:Uma2 family endonuclease n=1 Tax=unclassified Roseofilum TaxID=2620099 RepID=UPI001B0F8BAF|nr:MULTISPECIES: Uma2 family endonuclease [unclassified Roseofilum]MBP0013598.1 Uma2 family endonuclease [Roseofilum sp. SID3]MBP0025267.1 Uma2 family endonuclease [Roseofilum sp. SID2]MBP0037783.1 Uma2 family endonuclease [Roseofilum sp. SID1]MBP0041346.1 Uma2 family endonuclease [Roseofilum sp. SBFL]
MVTTVEKRKVISLEEFLAQPETKPASEYFNGEVSQKMMPQGKHSILQVELASAINQQAKPNKLAYALTELRCTFAGRSIVPDIAVIRWENLPRDEEGEMANHFDRHPDWIVEILSPDQPMALVMEKILFCLQNSTELGWLIDPKTQSITVFQSGLPKIYRVAHGDTEPLPMLTGLQEWTLSVNDIFRWLKA